MWGRLCLAPGVLDGPPQKGHNQDSGDWHFSSYESAMCRNGETFWKNHNRSRT